MNHALRNIPAESLRMHVCWGNYEGPHDHDIPLEKVLGTVLRAKPAACTRMDGLGTFAGIGKMDADISYKKLAALVEGAALASRRLW
jgi:hypothetical protein